MRRRKDVVVEEFVPDPKRLVENIKQLKTMSVIEWGNYAFSRDPIHKKVSDVQKVEFIQKAYQSGIDLAKEVKDKYGSITMKKLADKLSLVIKREDSGGSHDYIVFAKYNYPNVITLYMKNIDAMNAFMKEEKLVSLLDNVNVEDVLLAHEMYHYFEDNKDAMYAKDTKVTLWKIRKFEYTSGLIALGEIAAMAFAKALLGLTYNPYIFDSLMLFPHDYKKAEGLMKEIFAFKEEKDNE